ncbi:MAG: 2-phosphosulfolactate phosphatase [Verrucomicrobia bacterium]|nr:MAG: 2-phosphosulfolactate phosphatase [Verrucomicrobiota bacterium]
MPVVAMTRSIEVLFSPPEFSALAERDLSRTACVVLDILRATTTMMTALANGAEAVIPVSEIPEALAIRDDRPDVLLAGERNGLRLRAEQTGGVDFDFGNSPREFLPEKVRGRTIVMTTTNGTRALRACAHAETVLIGSFLNLRAVVNLIRQELPPRLILVCAGTHNQAALEDTLAAGALCERLWPYYASGHVADSAEIARRIYPLLQADLLGAMKHSRNGLRLLNHPELRGDVYFCVQRETLGFVAGLQTDGTVRKLVCEAPPPSGDTASIYSRPSA